MVKFLDRTTPMSMTSGGWVRFYDKIVCQGIVIKKVNCKLSSDMTFKKKKIGKAM